MLRDRLIATVVVRDGWVVQSFNFARYLPVGHPEVAVEFLAQWDVDEIVLLDISATPAGRGPDFDLVTRVAKRCFVPLTVGGGVRHLDDIHDLTHAGADKVSVNTVALSDPAILDRGAAVYGRQCMVASIDVRGGGPSAQVFGRCGTEAAGTDAVSWARAVEAAGAGEILLTSIDRNGSKQGYDMPLVRAVSDAVGIPVIASGGAGRPAHFAEALREAGASAVAAGNFFHFAEHSVIATKACLASAGARIRLESAARYEQCPIDARGRVGKRAEFTFDERV